MARGGGEVFSEPEAEDRDRSTASAADKMMITPPSTPAIMGTSPFPESDGVAPPELDEGDEEVKTSEDGPGHELGPIPCDEHAADVAAARKESTKERF
jgi:hypothetical protein